MIFLFFHKISLQILRHNLRGFFITTFPLSVTELLLYSFQKWWKLWRSWRLKRVFSHDSIHWLFVFLTWVSWKILLRDHFELSLQNLLKWNSNCLFLFFTLLHKRRCSFWFLIARLFRPGAKKRLRSIWRINLSGCQRAFCENAYLRSRAVCIQF